MAQTFRNYILINEKYFFSFMIGNIFFIGKESPFKEIVYHKENKIFVGL